MDERDTVAVDIATPTVSHSAENPTPPLSLSDERFSGSDTFRVVDTLIGGRLTRRSVMIATCGTPGIDCGDLSSCLMCPRTSGLARPLPRERLKPSPDESIESSVRQTKKRLRDLIIQNDLKVLLTLTMGKNAHTMEQALDLFSGFLHDKQHGRWFNRFLGGQYVAVAEPFADLAGWHVHAAIRTRLPERVLVRLKHEWTRYLQRRCGIAPPRVRSGLWRVNVEAPSKKKRYRNVQSLGGYLPKYVTKSLAQAQPGRHRYRPGESLSRPEKVVRIIRANPRTIADILFDGYRPASEVHTWDGRHLGWVSERAGLPPPLPSQDSLALPF